MQYRTVGNFFSSLFLDVYSSVEYNPGLKTSASKLQPFLESTLGADVLRGHFFLSFFNTSVAPKFLLSFRVVTLMTILVNCFIH